MGDKAGASKEGSPDQHGRPPSRAARAIVFLSATSIALLAASIYLLASRPSRDVIVNPQAALDDPVVRGAVVRQLMAANPGILDSHPDPKVARVLKPNVEMVSWGGVEVASNVWGMRERHYEMPKPEGTLRIVLLGDSYVLGYGIEARDRLGVHLERELALRARGDSTLDIECLHLGVTSWNTVAECTFVLRQLGELDPDLVVQVFVHNDLDDGCGVRGFGVRADFDPARPEWPTSRVTHSHPVAFLDAPKCSLLAHGLDWESRHRYEVAMDHVARLDSELARRGSAYLFLAALDLRPSRALLSYLREVLDDDRIALIGWPFMSDPANRISASNGHWNRNGQERMARFLYGLIQQRGLLPELDLSPWEEADLEVERLHEAELERVDRPTKPLRPIEVPSELSDATQIYGGIDESWQVAPYASVLLMPRGQRTLTLTGSFLDRPEIDGGTVELFVDERSVGRLEIEAGRDFTVRFPIDEELAARDYVAVRMVSDQWVYAGYGRRKCVSFVLDELRFGE
jgi:hypothetical protein